MPASVFGSHVSWYVAELVPGAPPEQVTDQLLHLSSSGIDGTLVSMVDYNQELPYWMERVMPLLEQAGLRKPQVQTRAAA